MTKIKQLLSDKGIHVSANDTKVFVNKTRVVKAETRPIILDNFEHKKIIKKVREERLKAKEKKSVIKK
jgi:hypothetical protein